MNTLRDETFYYQYEQNGGTVEMPKEVFWELYNDSKEEIERLNSIINEFEKILKEEKTRTRYANDVERFTAYDYMLKRLQELKGSDKDDN